MTRTAQITDTVKNLLGDDLFRIHVPSKIYHHGKLIDFPLSPLNLLKKLGPVTFTRAALQVLRLRFQGKKTRHANFESFALQTYGRILADKFLLNYSEKLWGAPCNRLSTVIAGTRMKGLNLKTFLTEAFLGSRSKTTHLEGSSFYYPKGGIATIADKLGDFCGPETST